MAGNTNQIQWLCSQPLFSSLKARSNVDALSTASLARWLGPCLSVPTAEVHHQITNVIAFDRELEGIHRAAPDPLIGVGGFPVLL